MTKKGTKKAGKKKKPTATKTSKEFVNYSKEIQKALTKLGIAAGDLVEIKKENITFEGNLLPQTELGNEEILVVKQENGYNVGLAFEDIQEIKALGEKLELEKFPSIKQNQKKKLPKISLLATGGTIASRLDYTTGGVVMASSPEEIFVNLPELYDEVKFKAIKMLFQMGSEDIAHKQWQIMAKNAAKELNAGARGVVIMHGTDMMGYSSAALSFMLQDLSGPVVFTGGQRSSDRGSFDGALNMISAARIAANSDFAHVMVSMHESSSDTTCLLSPGTNVRKMHTSRRDAFQTINADPIARIDYNGKIEEIADNIKRRNDLEVIPKLGYDDSVALIKIFPGADPELLDWYIDKGASGVIIEGTGLGHVPTFPPKAEAKRSWIPAIERAIEADLFVGMTSQCLYGRTHPYVYRALRTTFQKGVTYLGDMLPETALIKLGWTYGNYDHDDVQTIMMKNVAGELSPKTKIYGGL